MDKKILNEINRNREIMGLGQLIREAVDGKSVKIWLDSDGADSNYYIKEMMRMAIKSNLNNMTIPGYGDFYSALNAAFKKITGKEIVDENGMITTISTFGASGDYTSFLQSDCYEGEVSIVLTFVADENNNINGDITIEISDNSGMYFVSLTSVDNFDLNTGEMTGTILGGWSGVLIDIDSDENGVGDCDEETSLAEDISLWSIYPNPSSGLVNIAGDFTEEVVINVFDNIGQKVLSEKSALDIRLDLSSFGKGMYFIQIDGSNVYPVVID